MSKKTYLGELEQMVLWCVLRLGGDGYGASVLRELAGQVDRKLTTGALYATLDRLERKGMLSTRLADPEPGRGGRRKRYLTVTEAGRAALERTRRDWMRVWEGVPATLGANESSGS